MSNSHRGPFIDASYQVSVYLAKLCQSRRFFRNQPIRNKNCLWWPCLLMDRDEMSILYRGPSSIDASYQVSDQLALRFQRRRLKCEKLTHDRRRTPSDGKSSHCLWQGELNQRLPGACNRSPGSKLLSITMQLHCGGHNFGKGPSNDYSIKVWF